MAAMAGENLSEEEIDRMTMPAAMKKCREKSIKLGDIKELYKIKWLIKYHLMCQERRRSDAVSFLAQSGNHDRDRKEALAVLYDDTVEYTKQIISLDDPFVEELNKIYPGVCETLLKQKEKMEREVAPVLVLGETGSGKSSFINLLLGEQILPCSLLSNTHVICEIRYCGDGQKSSAKLYSAGQENSPPKEIKEGDDKTLFTTELGEHLQKLDGNKRAVYRLAKIFLPCDILKSGLLVVDSPGIGETKEMTSMVLDYMLNACAFIYVIDSTNAGGMQMRVKELVQKVNRRALEEQKVCRPDCAIFVCNKWDEVSMQDRNEVWEDTKKKIKEVWPECKEDQIICFSTLESLFIQEKGAISPTFETVLRNINKLLPVGQEVQLLKGYRYLDDFLTFCIRWFGTRLSEMDMTKGERETKRKGTEDRLHQVKSKITSFFEKQTKFIKGEVDTIAGHLKDFIDEETNTEKVCKFSEAELPKRKTWDEAAVEIRNTVYGRLRMVIKDWESGETKFGNIAKQIQDAFEKEFPALSKEIYDAEKMMSHSERGPSIDSEEDDLSLVPGFIANRFEKLSMGTKVILGIGLSPVLLVGMIVRLPVYGVQALDKYLTKYNMTKEFQKADNDKAKLLDVCEKYAKKTVAGITGKMNLREVINEDMQPLLNYLKQQQKRMEDQIQNDLDILKGLQDEERKDEDVRKMYAPMKAKYQILQERLEHFLLIYLPGCLIKELPFTVIEVTDKGNEKICSGLVAEIFRAKTKMPLSEDTKSDVCLRLAKEKIKADKTYQFRSVQVAYNTIRQTNIAMCYGVWNHELGSSSLCQVLEPLKCSLRDYSATTDFRTNHDNNCVRTMIEIVSALDYLHNRKFVHYDLSMDTVAVDSSGKVKLTNICPELQRVNIDPQLKNDKICLSKYIHLSSKFFKNKNRVRYRTRDDMYSVGIMMWELWTGQGVVELDKLFEIEPVFKQQVDTSGSWKSEDSRRQSRSSSGSSQSSVPRPKSKGSVNTNDSNDPSKSCTEDTVRENQQGPNTDVDETCDSDFVDILQDPEVFRNFLDGFRPKRTDMHFVYNYDKKRQHLADEWWQTLDTCLDENLSAAEWLKHWRHYPNFPELSLVFQQDHFNDK